MRCSIVAFLYINNDTTIAHEGDTSTLDLAILEVVCSHHSPRASPAHHSTGNALTDHHMLI